MKRILALILIVPVLFAAGCKKQTEAVDVLSSANSAAVTDVSAAPLEEGSAPSEEGSAPSEEGSAPSEEGSAPSEEGSAPPAASVAYEVVSTAAYVFDCAQGPSVYGAVEYRNTGSSPLRVTSATMEFSVGGSSLKKDFVPMLNQYDIVEPGQSSYLAIWEPSAELTSGAPASVTNVRLTCEQAVEGRLDLDVQDIYLADNYPGFSTLSGTVANASSASVDFSVVYTGFYDEAGELIGVWYFTKNASLEPGADKPFVVQMTELPIPGLAELVFSAKGVGFGFN